MANPQKKTGSDIIDNAIKGITSGEHQASQVESPRVTPAVPPAAPKAAEPKPAETSPAPAVASNMQVADSPKSNKKVQQNRVQLQGYLHNSWDVVAERGTELRDVLTPEYWLHVAVNLKPQDTVTVIAEDGTWYARLLVLSCDRLWAKVFKLEFHDLTSSYTDMPKTLEEEYEVVWTVANQYAVIKKSLRGQPPLKENFQSKIDAYQWLQGHLQTLNK